MRQRLLITYRVPAEKYNEDDWPGETNKDVTNGEMFYLVTQRGWYRTEALEYVLRRDTDPAGGMALEDLFNEPDSTYLHTLRLQQPDEQCPYDMSHTKSWCGNDFCRVR